ncbi:hypothetical protein D3C85_1245000 [compost metagenome]
MAMSFCESHGSFCAPTKAFAVSLPRKAPPIHSTSSYTAEVDSMMFRVTKNSQNPRSGVSRHRISRTG